MNLDISADFNIAEVDDYIEKESQLWFDEMVETLREKGRKYVTMARTKTKDDGGFGNITWNLRSSIGYCLAYQGKIVESYFPKIKGGTVGEAVGRELAERLAIYSDQDSEDVTLILVAGMEYALYVERTQRDVIKISSQKFTLELNDIWAA